MFLVLSAWPTPNRTHSADEAIASDGQHLRICLETQPKLREHSSSVRIPLMNLKLDGDHLLFEFKEDDDPDSTHWRMNLIDANRADLQWIELPAGFKAKSFHLIKASEGREN